MADDENLVAGRYRLRSRVGLNDLGEVWQARDEQLGRDVAVKQLVPHPATGKAAMRAMREARLAAKLSHPHAVTVFDVIEHRGRPCLVMEFLPTSLAELLVERGPLPQGMVATIGSQIAAALTVAHSDGIVHRDVSPGNVLLTRNGTAKIADFGISRALGEPTVTDRPFVPGTPAYLAPEVAAGTDATTRSDVYSLGATLYAALEGRPPIGAVGDDTEEILARIADEEVVAPARTGALADVLLRMLRRDPDERPTMAKAGELLAKAAVGRAVVLDPPPVAPRRTRRRRMTLGAVIVGALAVTTGTGLAAGSALNKPVVATSQARLPGAPSAGGAPDAGQSGGGSAECVASAQVTESWAGGYKVLVTVRNVGPVGMKGWTVAWQSAAGRQVDDLWDGKVDRSGTRVTVVNEVWNGVVAVDGSTDFGLVTRSGGADRTAEPLGCRAR